MSLKQFFVSLFVCAALLQVGLRCARAEPAYEVTLEDEFGNTLPSFPHRGERWAMGRYGQRYNVRITNHTPRRVEAVVTVDGRDVLTGKPGDFKRQRGYLVPAYDSVVIDGFRTSLSEVAVFRFTDPGNSYSARMGTPENVGVIGAAFFPEAPPPAPPVRRYLPAPAPRPSYRGEYDGDGVGGGGLGTSGAGKASREPARSAPAADSAPASAESSARGDAYRSRAERESRANNLGTEYGEAEYSSVEEVPFRRARSWSPDRVLTLRYDDREGLEARGIVTRRRPPPAPEPGPVAFPANRFAPPPPPYRTWD